MSSSLFVTSSPKVLLLCISCMIVSFYLQACDKHGGEAFADAKGTDGTPGSEDEARAMLFAVQEKCSAKCNETCTYEEKNFLGHLKEVSQCHTCLGESCKEEFQELKRQAAQHWDEPVCTTAREDAAACWDDTSECVELVTTCWKERRQKKCDFAKLGQCWHDYSSRCMEKYLPCCYKDGDSSNDGSDGSNETNKTGGLK